MDEKVQHIIALIEHSDLDQTIKDILIRDLKADGLTDFLREQIKAYCLQGIEKNNELIEKAKQALEQVSQNENPV
jgi:uncharacterized protein (DUF2164 family)